MRTLRKFSLSLSEFISFPTIGWGTVVSDPISEDKQPLIVKALSSAPLFDYMFLSLCVFPKEKKIEFGNYLVELCKGIWLGSNMHVKCDI